MKTKQLALIVLLLALSGCTGRCLIRPEAAQHYSHRPIAGAGLGATAPVTGWPAQWRADMQRQRHMSEAQLTALRNARAQARWERYIDR